MSKSTGKSASLGGRGAQSQFFLGVLLTSVIPLLVLAYVLVSKEHLAETSRTGFYMLLGSAFSLMALGYALLCKYPINIARLYREIEPIMRGEIPKKVSLMGREGDIRAIEDSMNHMIEQLNDRLALLEREKEALKKELYSSNKLKAMGTVAAGIAHEINTPVQFVSDNTRYVTKAADDIFTFVGSVHYNLNNWQEQCRHTSDLVAKLSDAEGLANLVELQREIPQALKESQEGLERIASIVHAMRDFAHMGEQDKAMTDINRLIESAVTISRSEWKHVAEVVFDLDPDLPSVECFPGDITQVVLNLIINASHAIDDKNKESLGGMGKITLSTRPQDDAVTISVTDTGSGIPEEVRDRIFEHFFTTKAQGEGTGQGLAICKSLIEEKNGGTLTFETELGSGTTFTTTLPIVSKASPDDN